MRIINSFANAFRGLCIYVSAERNAWIHCIAAILVIAAGFLFRIEPYEWMAVVFAIGIVFSAEAFNTTIERLSDVVQPNKDDRIRNVKDISAGAVLICAISAACIGLIIFLPKVISLLFCA